MPIEGSGNERRRSSRVAKLACALVLLVSWWGTPGGAPAAAFATDAAAAPLRVMPLGDSITDGYTIPAGYRVELWRLLAEAGYGVDFVGSQQNGPASLPDKQHEGHSGWCIAPIASSVPGWLATYKPDVVLLLIGTNDLHEGNYPAAWKNGCNYNDASARLSSLIDTITAASPSVRVIVGTLPPQTDKVSNDRVQAYNAAIPGMVGSKAASGARVSWANVNGALTVADLADQVHPNAEGYRKIAGVWREALLRCASGFADVPDSHPACAAIAALSTQGIIRGYATTPPTFGPGDNVQRAQMAAFLVRALGWQGRPTGPRNFNDFGPLVGELRESSLILANACDGAGRCVAQGYGNGKFGPNDRVTHAQVISFVARAFQLDPARAWQPQAGAHPYVGVPAVHDPDVRAYHHYAGAIPDAPTTAAGWNAPASRAWVARALFQALQAGP